ncbi:Pantothenate metabolism flavoprotein [Halorhabdus tiamatea SARL4B]|uniref:Coenzyme A biosynthesis bifunctional protein CoaBC n=1 Tax=Halorhabdus tiamatea SARL4B TaxID=1033806 RepID=F7PLA7_9EURY|nr:bifunctional phosphopantothenoylcysteine decarboxylase/phosphopantothenate--cysteine ligase CoaBC [Halorhabdus tiamatea]ERJ05198.1 Pantothenate metabolism flavoprotein [Halorhabdus tiamatea SARL4B]CCQ34733.1 phosphopantothenoylcysteine decarboxylase / phosphopantothenoylcysteine synthetase [Halorhabdus tiamatea SARL4B]
MLEDTNVVLGVTGSIAAVKTVELAHELRRRGATVRAVMTDSATNIVHPWAVELATDGEVVTEIGGGVEHVTFFGEDPWGDVLLIAPSTANTVGKVAAAIDDTPVTTCATTALGAGIPVVIAPAMHEPMYDHPGVLEAIERLESWGVAFADPRIEESKAKIASEEAIVLETARAAGDRPLEGKEIVVTSGATTESIDAIRTLSNRASGTTGRAIAKACYVQGADVTLLHDGPNVPYATVEPVESASKMVAAAEERATDADALVSAAAIGDYTVEKREGKIRSGQDDLSLELTPTPKLLDRVRERAPDLPMVGFKLEADANDEELTSAARDLLSRVDLSLVVANDAGAAGSAETRALLVGSETTEEFRGSKASLGTRIAEELVSVLRE